MDRFWQVRNVSEDEGELILYGNIASRKSWWDESNDGIYPRQFADDLKSLGNIKSLTVRLNSSGGDVFAATAIYTQLKAHAANVTVVIDGVAASAATIIMAAADTVKAPSNALVMVHNPLFVLYGYYNTEALAKMSGVLETVKESILNAYVNKTGRDRKDLSAMMDKETWLTAEEAKAEGFVDEIMFDQTVEASITNDNRFMVVNSVAHDVARFEAVPALNQVRKSPTVPVIPLVQNKSNQKGDETTLEIKNAEDLKKQFPAIYDEVVAAATTAERDRIKAIEEIAANISEELVSSAKFVNPMNAAELALAAMKADAGKGLKFIENRQQELQVNNGVKDQTPPNDDEQKKAIEAQNIDLIAAAANAGRGKEAK